MFPTALAAVRAYVGSTPTKEGSTAWQLTKHCSRPGTTRRRGRRSSTSSTPSPTEGGDGFVAPEERIATFDNDGTLWAEKPIPIQLDFTLRRFAEMAEADPQLREQQPYKASYEHDLGWLGQAMVKHYHGDDGDLGLLMAASPKAFADLTVEEYSAKVAEFFRTADHPTLGRPYRTCGYQPMVELLRFLEANGFVTYIASGGDRDFMRPIAGDLYGIPPERVIGSSLAIDYRESDDDARGRAVQGRDGLLRRRPDQAGAHLEPDRAPAGARRRQLQRRHRRCCASPRRATGRRCACSSSTTTPSASSTTPPAPRRRSSGPHAAGWTVISIKNDWATVFAD